MQQHTRKAVGAIVVQDNEYLLVHKVKNIFPVSANQTGIWDFPKGGIQEAEIETDAVLRELQEETGSHRYQIIKRFDEKMCFVFNEEAQALTGYARQETTMFLVAYQGDRTDLTPQDNEIAQVRFFPANRIVQWLSLEETKQYFQHVINESPIR